MVKFKFLTKIFVGVYFMLLVARLIVSISAVDCLQRLIALVLKGMFMGARRAMPMPPTVNSSLGNILLDVTWAIYNIMCPIGTLTTFTDIYMRQ